jgi:hypothetical protein
MQLLKTIEQVRVTMSGSMFDSVKNRIGEKLSSERPGADVRVLVDRTPYGVWIWNEAEKAHVQMKNQEILKALGETKEVHDYIEGLETVQLAWKEVIGPAADGKVRP